MMRTPSPKPEDQDWIGGLPQELRDEVIALMSERRYAHGEMIYRAGDPGEEMFRIASGNVRVYTLTEEGRELLYDLLPRLACFGESALIDDGPRPHMSQAVGETRLWVLPRHHFERLWKSSPEVSIGIARVMQRRSRRLYNVYEQVSMEVLSRRMAGRLCSLADIVGDEQVDGVHFRVRITQEDIGSLVAGSRQSVNRILKQWECEGVIDVAYGSLVIRNKPHLKRIAERQV